MVVRNFVKSKSVKQNRKNRRSSKLLKAACAGLLGAGFVSSVDQAKADVVDESSFVGDFGDTFADADTLPLNTTGVTGEVISPDIDDYFRWNELQPGSNFSVNAELVFSTFSLLDSGNVVLDSVDYPGGVVSVSVPIDGAIVGRVNQFEGNGTYTVSVVPEPGAGSLLSLGALGLLGRRRKTNDES